MAIKGTFGPTVEGPYPATMRRQLWPLCCGASILSGLKAVHNLSEEQLTKDIVSTIDEYIPDLQVFKSETMMPNVTFLTLNADQMASSKIMKAILAAGFTKYGEATLRGHAQGFFVRDLTKTFKVVVTDGTTAQVA